jgi:hypothetical protein
MVKSYILTILIGLISFHVAEAGCPGNCEPNGKCVTGTRSVHCECDPGFTGSDCSFPYVQCDDGYTTCYNGAECVRSLSDKDPSDTDGRNEEYECDCDSIPNGTPFVIAQCQNPVDDVCERGVEISAYAFCTNSGSCREMVESGETHPGCKCPLEYEGRHCQYREGTAPPEELLLVWNDDPSDEDPFEEFEEEPTGTMGWVFISMSLVLIVAGGFAYFVFARLKKLSDDRTDVVGGDMRDRKSSFDDLRLENSFNDLHLEPGGFDDVGLGGAYSDDDDDIAKHII